MKNSRLVLCALLGLIALTFSFTLAHAACREEAIEQSDLPLENTQWKLNMIAEQPVASSPRQPHMTLNSEQHTVGGHGGCNGFGGSYRLDAEKLSFSQLMSTMMYCEDTMETEKAFLAALENCASFSIEGRSLEIFDAEGLLLAVFEGSALSHGATE